MNNYKKLLIGYQLACFLSWFGGLNVMRIPMKFSDWLNLNGVGKVTL